MKYFLIGFAIWFALATLPQLFRVWAGKIEYQRKKKNHPKDEDWIYQI